MTGGRTLLSSRREICNDATANAVTHAFKQRVRLLECLFEIDICEQQVGLLCECQVLSM